MKVLVLTMFATVSVCGGCGGDRSGENETTIHKWGFEEDVAEQLPAGFTSLIGKWQIATDESARSKSHVLAQLAASEDHIYNVALVENSSYRDVDISVRLRSVSGRVDQGGGLVWRAQDVNNYYVARYNPLEDNFRVYKVVDGQRKQLESAALRIDHEAWHVLKIVMREDHIECYLNGEKHLDVHDTTFSNAGKIGLWTKADAVTQFDDLSVSEAPSPAQ